MADLILPAIKRCCFIFTIDFQLGKSNAAVFNIDGAIYVICGIGLLAFLFLKFWEAYSLVSKKVSESSF